LHGKSLFGVPIFSPDDILKKNYTLELPKIIIAISNESIINEIQEILKNSGLKEEKDFEVFSIIKVENIFKKRKLEKQQEEQLEELGQRAELHRMLKSSKKIVYTANEEMKLGGLSDRFRGIMFLYKLAITLGVEFKINWQQPSDIRKFVIPNKYNWEYENEIGKSIVTREYMNKRVREYFGSKAENYVEHEIKSLLSANNDEVHIATNFVCSDIEYSFLFKYLFKLSEYFQGKIDEHLKILGVDFISAHFRFIGLLNDFDEHKIILEKDKQMQLLNRCLADLQEIHNENPGKKILVASDSITFIEAARSFDFVYTIPGKIGHISLRNEIEAFEKTLLDFFCIAHSKKAYSVVEDQMYEGNFAYRAALLNNSAYIRLPKIISGCPA
jgi:hypothetical protein